MNLTNPYAAALEWTFQDLKELTEEELESWYEGQFTEKLKRGRLKLHSFTSMVSPLNRATYKLGTLAYYSIQRGDHS